MTQTAEIVLIDLGALYWRSWLATKSQFISMTQVIDKCEHFSGIYNHVIVCADSPKNWRYDVTATLEREKQYKANRPKKDPEAVLNLQATEERLAQMGYPVVKCEGYEADDVIATLVAQAWARTVHIYSDDKDLYQLISSTCTMITRGGNMGADECMRKFGVYPSMIREWLAIMGDSADNVEGCPRVGGVKAALLLHKFGSVESIKKATFDELTALPGIGKAVAEGIAEWDPEIALELVSLKTNCPIGIGDFLKKAENLSPFKAPWGQR